MASPLGQKTISVPAPVDVDTIFTETPFTAVPYPYVTRYIKPVSSARLVFGIYIPCPPYPPDLLSIYPESLPHLPPTVVAKMQSKPSPSPKELSATEPATMATSSNEIKTDNETNSSSAQAMLSTKDEALTQAIPYPPITPQIEPASSLSPQTSALGPMQGEPSASPKELHDTEPATMAESSNEVNTGDQTDCSPVHTTLSTEDPTDFSGSTWFDNIGEEMAQKIRNLVVNIHKDTVEERVQEVEDSDKNSDDASNRPRIDRREAFQVPLLSKSTAYWRLPPYTNISRDLSLTPSTPAPFRPRFGFEPPVTLARQDDDAKMNSYPPPGLQSLETPPRREITTFRLEDIFFTSSDNIGNSFTSDTK
jgi:hypothetical protein